MINTRKKEWKFTSEEISLFCDQIAMFLNGGIPIHEGIHILYGEMEDNRTKERMKIILNNLNQNYSFCHSLEETKAFPEYMMSMVRIGEATGKLEEIMRSLSIYYERESIIKSNIRSAIIYPIVLFTIMATIMLVLVFKILPFFESMFLELNAEVANATESIMDFGVTLGRTAAIAMAILLVVILLLGLWYQTKQGEHILNQLSEKLKLLRNLANLMATGKFVSSMALLISSGMEHEEAMMLASKTSSNRELRQKVLKCKELIRGKMPFETALRKAELIVGMEARMLSVSAKSGLMDTALTKLGEQFDRKITVALNKKVMFIEMCLSIMLTLIIGIVLISVMMPLISMLSSIG
jgi:type IV pilus assembly protein PilC